MQLRHLRTFAAVASTLNITRAAEQVHLAQSSVTEQIQTLEADLGTPLFDRSRRGLRLTEAGRRLLDYAEPLLSLAQEARAAVAEAAAEAAGALTVGGLETLCATALPSMLARFREKLPAIGLTLKAAGSRELRGGLKSGAMDVCFAFGGGPFDAELESETIAQEGITIIMPAGHRLAGRQAIGPADLAGEAFLVTETGCTYRRMFDEAFPSPGAAHPRIAGEFGSMAAIRRMVETGLGCALVPRLAVSDALPGIRVLPWTGQADTVPISMLWRRRRVQPPALRLLLETARESFAALTPADARPRHAARSL
jgi:DNA-binding transcriptional LysR family regulator